MSAELNSGPSLQIARELLREGRFVRLKVKGKSMAPFIRDGELVKVEPTPASRVKFGDVVFFSNGQANGIVHRVIAKFSHQESIFFATKGDSSQGFDNCVGPEDLLGKVVAVTRSGRDISLQSFFYRGASIILAAATLFTIRLRAIVRRRVHET